MELAGRLRGIFPPLVTPFTSEGALDLAAFEANLESYQGCGLAGLLVLGSNGEASLLDEPEKLALVRAARRAGGDQLLLAGVGLESTQATIALARKAADAGADAVLVLPPFYFRSRMSDDVLRRHFEAVADASRVPVLLYSVPQVTGAGLSPALVAALQRHPNVAGIKESSGDVALLGRIAAAAPASFAALCGSGPVIYPALCVGARGGILAVACCSPRPAAQLFEAVQRGDHARARRLQEALLPLAAAVTSGHGVPGLKAAMELAGFRGGSPRAPLAPVGPAVREELRALLRGAAAEAA
jgi:4-hydroxy-2-oxoglutarate aldolase